jgi:hypothetical protein
MSTKLKAGTSTSGAVLDADTTGILELQTGSTPTTAVTINTSQNVGVGVTPNVWATDLGLKAIQVSTTGCLYNYAFGGNNFTSVTDNSFLDIGGNATYITTNSASQYVQSAGSHRWSTASSGTAGTTISMSERMRIDSSGNFIVGKTTSATGTAGFNVNPAGNGANIPLVNSSGADSTNNAVTYQVYSTSASAFRFYVGYGGTVYATSTTISGVSDQRFKENIVDLDDGLNKILELKPRKFDWKEGKGADTKNARGFIAQEFETIFPDLIDEWKDPAPEGEEPYKSVRADLIPVLVKAIQELNAKVDAQALEIQALKGTA